MENSLQFPPPVKRLMMNTTLNTHPRTSTFNGGATYKPPLYLPPGHVAFRLLCHASRIDGLIGKCGAVVKHIEQHTNSKIRVEYPDDSSGDDEMIVAVISSPAITNKIKLLKEENNEEELIDVSAAQEGLIRVFERLIEVSDVAPVSGGVSCRLLVCRDQGGALIGRGGMNVVEKIKMDTGTKFAVLNSEKFFSDSSPMDVIVEIEGDVLAVKKALIAVTSRLQKPRLLDSINDTLTGGPSSLEKVPDMDSRTQQEEVVFKILCPKERVGCIIGKEGSTIKALQNETGASVIIGPPLAGCKERLITVTAMESVKSEYSPAQTAAVLVFNRSMDAGVVKGLKSGSKGSPVSARVLVSPNQVDCLLGKGGAIISEMRKVTGAGLWLLGSNPKCAPENDEVLQITGEFVNVREALYQVTGRLRDHVLWTNRENIMDISRRSPSVSGGIQLGSGNRSVIVTNTTVEILVPDTIIGFIYWEYGSNLARLRQISGAKVMVLEPLPGTTESTFVISGTPEETQAAVSLLQTFVLVW